MVIASQATDNENKNSVITNIWSCQFTKQSWTKINKTKQQTNKTKNAKVRVHSASST